MSISETAHRIRTGASSVEEVMEGFIATLKAHNAAINAVVVFDEERARVLAQEAAAVPADARGPYHGVPITIKEQYDVAGWPTTLGLPDLKDTIAQANEPLVQRLIDLGFIIAGKTNVPVALSDHQTANPLYGLTQSPVDPGLTPGGSSGGSAAALAAGITDLELGSDIGGSLRVPAHFSGVCSHKPTYGLLTTRMPFTLAMEDLATPGPMARDIATLEALLPELIGDPLTFRPALPLQRCDKERLSEFRVALWSDDERCPIASDYKALIDRFAQRLAQAGATVDPGARPDHDAAQAAAVGQRLMWAALSAAMPPPMIAQYADATAGAGDGDWSLETCRAQGLAASHVDWHRWDAMRCRTRSSWNALLSAFDVMIMPIHLDGAFAHDLDRPLEHRVITVDGTQRKQMDAFFWIMQAHPEGLPATTLPIGTLPDGRPAAVQIAARSYGDRTALRFAALAQDMLG